MTKFFQVLSKTFQSMTEKKQVADEGYE